MYNKNYLHVLNQSSKKYITSSNEEHLDNQT